MTDKLKIILSDLVFIHNLAAQGEVTPNTVRDLLKNPIADLSELIEENK